MPDDKIKHAAPVPPFVKFVASAVPMVFDNSLSYYEALCALWKFIQDDVINVINNNANVTEEYINLVDELKTYVENYFANLDVQEEINNKLDAMVEDGTFLTLITPIVQDDMATLTAEINATKDEADSTLAQCTTLNNKADKVLARSINSVRKAMYPRFTEFNLPVNITDTFFNDFEILSNNEGKYVVNFDETKYINQGGSTYYIAVDGVNNLTTNDGSYEKPWMSLNYAMNRITAGDTIILKDGLYSRQNIQLSETGDKITKSVNILAEHKGSVYLTTADYDYTWLQNDTYSDVYEVTRSNVRRVLDITRISENIFLDLENVSSLQACHETENSWYQSGSTCYVHMYDGVTPSPDNIILGLQTGQSPIVCGSFADDAKIYIKDINIIEGDKSGITCNSNGENVTIFIDNVDVYNISCSGYARDGFSNIGCKSICRNVHMGNIGKDGFNYHEYGTTHQQAIGIEIDCSCFNTGYGETTSSHLSNNATTAHESSQVVRVNGLYGYANGSVIADVNSVNSVCLGCEAMDGYGTYNYDVLCQTDSIMYLYDCNFVGSRAGYNLVTSGDNAHIYYNANTTFDTKIGNVSPIA